MSKVFNKKISLLNGQRLAFILVIILGLFCTYLKIQNNKVVQTLESSYSRSLYELVDYLDDVETLLAKAQISSSAEYAAKTLTDVWRKADLAQEALSQIPVTHMTLEKVLKYLNQLSDYSYYVSRKAMEDENLTEEELKNLKKLYERCKELNITLNNVVVDMGSGTLSWSELTKEESNAPFAQEVANLSQESFGKIEENLQDYEGLIYDGPFSEHMTSSTPLGLPENTVTKEEAENSIYEVLDKSRVKDVKYNGLIEDDIKVHSFDLTLNDDTKFYTDVTECGGKILWFVENKNIDKEKISFEEAKANALKFLDTHGLKDMKETYYIKENGMVTINFAYVDNGVVCYPDLVKVKVALDDGSIIGMEAQSYYSSHHNRKMGYPKISLEQAKSKLNTNIEILSEGFAIIPTDWRTELLTYEFKGKIDDNEFLVYVNAEDGKEEKIFMIVDTPNGVLTI